MASLRPLLNFHNRLDEHDIKRREIGVLFKDLRVVGVGASASYQPTFGSSLNPLNFLNNFRGSLRPATRDILAGFEGVVRPGEMLCESIYALLRDVPLTVTPE